MGSFFSTCWSIGAPPIAAGAPGQIGSFFFDMLEGIYVPLEPPEIVEAVRKGAQAIADRTS